MSRTVVTALVIVTLLAAGLGLYFVGKRWHQEKIEEDRLQTQNQCLEFIRTLEAQLEGLQAQLAEEQERAAADEIYPQVFGTPAPPPTDAPPAPACETVAGQLDAFFQYLDNQGHLGPEAQPGAAAKFVRTCARLLAAQPPVNVAEMQQVVRLMKNVTHLYRVLGKQRLLQARAMLAAEGRVIEPAMDLLFTWMVTCRRPLPGDQAPIDIERLYDYAGYFLNTLGGRSYLLRRESRLRMLVNYYSILMVDLANDEKFNQYGIDIRPYIDYLFYDISNQKGLAYRQRYLTRLAALRDKYM